MNTPAVANGSSQILAAYESWAPLYPPMAHNPLMRAEERAMFECWPAVAGLRVLDLACGTGRYSRLLAQRGAREVIAVDFCAPMLAQVEVTKKVRASMMQLPFAAGAFDVVICGLAIGHAPDVRAWMAEIGRVLKTGGVLLYSDFHIAAYRTGLPRSFKDQQGRLRTVPHCPHDLASQRRAAGEAGLAIDAVRVIRAGFELREAFTHSMDFYARYYGLPLVLVVRARK